MSELDLIDMHTHTWYSDGELTPDELILRAKEKGVGTLAITDHDTLLGVQNVTIPKEDMGIELINGIELSIKYPVGTMHILGQNIDIWNTSLNEKMEELHNNSLYSASGIICQLKKDFDIVFSTDEILGILNSKRNIGRPDIAKLLIKYGYVSSVKEAFEKYLIAANERIGGITKGIPYEEAINLINKAGGLSVLAHPKSLEMPDEELDKLVKELAMCGLDSIEAYHSSHSETETKKYLDLAEKYNLLVSGGSDYHGPNVKPDIEVGHGKGNIKIKQLTLLDKIKNSSA